MDVRAVSKGLFTYVKNVEMRFDYTEPRIMSMLVDGTSLRVITEEKTTTYSLKSQKNALAEMSKIMRHCMEGHLHELNTEYALTYEAMEKEYTSGTSKTININEYFQIYYISYNDITCTAVT